MIEEGIANKDLVYPTILIDNVLLGVGMSEEEQLLLEDMQKKENKLKLELDNQEAEMRAQQQLLKEQEAERNRLVEEYEAMQKQVSMLA